jgi:inorganic phosphate transporter, PiT family
VEGDILLVVVVVVALGFDFTNGFHDTARGRDLDLDAGTPAEGGVAIAAVANLVGAFVTTAVAKTVGSGVLDTNLVTTKTVLAALFGAIAWNLATWWLGLPFNSSHALSGAWWERESPSPGSATSSGTTWRTR